MTREDSIARWMDSDSAAERAKELFKKLGIEKSLWLKYPVELLEFRMDRPPQEPGEEASRGDREKWETRMRDWKPLHGPKARVYATYMRYSWCYPICMEYAVVMDKRGRVILDHMDRPMVLSEEGVADILGLSKQRVSNVVLDLVADKLIRVERAPNRQHTMAVNIEAKPVITDEERRVKSTLDATGVEGPLLEPAVLRRFVNLLNELGADGARVLRVPVEGEGGQVKLMTVADYRTLVWTRIGDNRTVFLKGLKSLRYSERKSYGDIATEARNLIAETLQSPESGVAAAVDSTPPVAAAKSPSAEAKVSATQPPVAPEAQARQKPAKMEAAGEVLKRMPEVPAPDPQIEHLANVLGDWLETTIPYESARVLLDKCRKRVPQAQPPISDEEVLAVCSDIVLGKGGLRSANWKRLDNPMGLFVEVAPTYFPKALQNRRSTKA
jgi:plasmid maintenance system antidote protein VapI